MNNSDIVSYLKKRKNTLLKNKSNFGVTIGSEKFNFNFALFYNENIFSNKKIAMFPLNFSFPVNKNITDKQITELFLIELYLRVSESSDKI